MMLILRSVLAMCISLMCAMSYAAGPKVNSNVELRFTCLPKTIHDGERVTFRFAYPHAVEFGVWGPDRRFRWLVWPRDLNIVPPILSGDAFEFVTELTIPSGQPVANPMDKTDPRLEPIFSKLGRYTFVLSQNLESHRYPVGKCTVQYVGARKVSSNRAIETDAMPAQLALAGAAHRDR
jgi:hypothetical protein